MRPQNSSATQYNPAEPPSDPAQIPRYLKEEFAKMSAAISALAEGYAPVVYALPAKPREGMLRHFDGVLANPIAAGKGLYLYSGTAWVKL